MRSLAASILCFALAGCATPSPPQTPLQRYRAVIAAEGACPGFGNLDLARLDLRWWAEPVARTDFHHELRAKHGLTLPSGDTRVLIGWSGGHHDVVGGSVVAVREASGSWAVSGVSTYRSLVPPQPGGEAPVEQVDVRSWRIAPEDARRLDALVDGRCLEAEPRQIYLAAGPYRLDGSQAHCVGSSTVTTEVEIGGLRRVSAQHCGEWGAVGEVRKRVLRGAGR